MKVQTSICVETCSCASTRILNNISYMPGLLWETHDSNPCLWRLARAQALKGEGVMQYARLAQASRRVPARDAASIGIQMGRDQDRTGDSRLLSTRLTRICEVGRLPLSRLPYIDSPKQLKPRFFSLRIQMSMIGHSDSVVIHGGTFMQHVASSSLSQTGVQVMYHNSVISHCGQMISLRATHEGRSAWGFPQLRRAL